MTNIKNSKRIAIVFDDSKRTNLIEWSYFNKDILGKHEIISYEITAELLKGTLNAPITSLVSGAPGDYRELTQMIGKKDIDVLIFFGDPSKIDMRQTGVNDMLALALEQDIVIACNLATADIVIRSLQGSSAPQTRNKKNRVAKSSMTVVQ
ncbi:MAG: methylglyoxal synthase [Chitinophagaceae bacterium]|nr:methylglyoxal synthase [Chitinophagaceae bacterium]